MKKYILKIIFALSLFAGSYSQAAAFESLPILLHDDLQDMRVDQNLSYAVTPLDNFVDVRAAYLSDPDFFSELKTSRSLGMLDKNVWVALKWKNLSEAEDWFIAVEPARLEKLQVFVTNGEWQLLATGKNEIKNRAGLSEKAAKPFVRLKLPAKSGGYLLVQMRSRFSVIQPDIRILNYAGWQTHKTNSTFIFGVYFGFLILAAIYNLFLYFFNGHRLFLVYSVYILFLCLTHLGLTGYGLVFIPGLPFQVWSDALFLWGGASSVTGSLFAYFFLKIEPEQFAGRLIKILIVAVFALTMATAGMYIAYLPLSIKLMQITSMTITAISIVILGVALVRSLQRVPNARLFLAAWGTLLAGTIIYTMYILGVLPGHPMTTNAFYIGSAIEVFLISLGVAHYFRTLAKEADTKIKVARAKAEYVSAVAHEIRSPLNIIMGTVDLIAESGAREVGGTYIKSLNQATKNLRALIDDVLDLSQLEAEQLKINKRVFRVADLVTACENLHGKQIKNKGLSLEFDLQLGRNITFLGDDTRILQILSNLIANSLKFTQKGGITLAIGRSIRNYEPLKGNANYELIRFSVTDTGIGIAPEQLEKIFEPFVQIENGVQGTGGSGLGLAIVKKLADTMDGTVFAEINPTGGTVIHVEIPLPIIGEIESKVEDKKTISLVPPSGYKILFAEDLKENRDLFGIFLADIKNHIAWAENGQAALELHKETPFDLVFMDIHMPVMDGIEAVKKIRAFEKRFHHRKSKIYMLTGDTGREEINKSIAAGADGFLTKPVSKQELLEAIAGQIAGYRLIT